LEPLFTLLIVTAWFLPGTRAMFLSLPIPGSPAMPGPLMKKPNTSLYCEPTYSLYSSEPNTKSNRRLSPAGITSNSKVHASRVVLPLTVFRMELPDLSCWKVLFSTLFGPTALLMVPLVSRMPSSMPSREPLYWN